MTEKVSSPERQFFSCIFLILSEHREGKEQSLEISSRLPDPDATQTPKDFHCRSVLCLAELELMFPTAALTVLCDVLVARKVWIIHQCSGYC